MLPKQYRLSLKKELKRIKTDGKIVNGEFFSLLVALRLPTISHCSSSRFAFIVSAKVHKRAVKRNRVKRLLGEAVNKSIVRIKPGYDCVFLVKKSAVGKKLGEINKETERLFAKAGLFG